MAEKNDLVATGILPVIRRQAGSLSHRPISGTHMSIRDYFRELLQKMKDSARYAKIVEWSDEDQCYVGSAPGLILGGCHGSDEKEVFAELCEIVEEAIALYRADGKPLPPPTAGRDFANKMQDVA